MSLQIKLMVESEDTDDIISDLIEVDDIDVQLAVDRTIVADEQRQHPLYSLDSNNLTSILIIIPAIITSLTGLVKVILDYKLKTAQQKRTRKKALQDKEPSIVIEGKVIPLTKFSSAEELTTFLEEKLKKEEHYHNRDNADDSPSDQCTAL